MENHQNPNQQQMDIELNEEVAEGHYSNLAIITHSHAEFIIDFIKIMPGVPKGKVKSRIILTPHHAKSLLRALNDNIKRFEQTHGVIEEQNFNFPVNFGGPIGQA
jgi:ribonuclease BN (tRNA processing enzyme)